MNTILTSTQLNNLITTLKTRFDQNPNRHKGFNWNAIEEKITNNPKAAWALYQMENTKGEPDVIEYNHTTNEYIFYDCSPESPTNRRSLCYDNKALNDRKEHKPKNSALDMALEMGIEILSYEQYLKLQNLGDFDTKTSSWVATPKEIRALGGALFCDKRYNQVFVYHNGAQSYYASRGFRGFIKV